MLRLDADVLLAQLNIRRLQDVSAAAPAAIWTVTDFCFTSLSAPLQESAVHTGRRRSLMIVVQKVITC